MHFSTHIVCQMHNAMRHSTNNPSSSIDPVYNVPHLCWTDITHTMYCIQHYAKTSVVLVICRPLMQETREQHCELRKNFSYQLHIISALYPHVCLLYAPSVSKCMQFTHKEVYNFHTGMHQSGLHVSLESACFCSAVLISKFEICKHRKKAQIHQSF